jgi:hypothetical protein
MCTIDYSLLVGVHTVKVRGCLVSGGRAHGQGARGKAGRVFVCASVRLRVCAAMRLCGCAAVRLCMCAREEIARESEWGTLGLLELLSAHTRIIVFSL